MKQLKGFMENSNSLKDAKQKLADDPESLIAHPQYKDILKSHDYKFYPKHSHDSDDEWRRGRCSVAVGHWGWQHFSGQTDTNDGDTPKDLDSHLTVYHNRGR